VACESVKPIYFYLQNQPPQGFLFVDIINVASRKIVTLLIKRFSALSCYFPPSRTQILSTTPLSSNILSLTLRVTDQVSNAYKTTGKKNLTLCDLILVFTEVTTQRKTSMHVSEQSSSYVLSSCDHSEGYITFNCDVNAGTLCYIHTYTIQGC
jgi:hypothetical protein